ncbi:hypothetical protein AVEN_169539-1, partial [Araneus ventricosus]
QRIPDPISGSTKEGAVYVGVVQVKSKVVVKRPLIGVMQKPEEGVTAQASSSSHPLSL